MALIECPLRKTAITTPEATAILVNDEAVSALQLDSWVEAYKKLLQQHLSAGDRLLVLPTHSVEAVVIIWACFRAQVVFCPVNPSFPEAQIKQYSQRIGAHSWVDSRVDSRVDSWVADDAIGLNEMTELEKPQLTTPEKPVATVIMLDGERLCSLIATSGTTGVPKAVAHSLSNHWLSAKGSRTLIPLGSGDGWLLSLPLFHVGGFSIVVRCLQAGAAMVMNQNKHSTRSSLRDSLNTLPITHISLVNTQLFRLVNGDEMNLKKTELKFILLGGGVASASLVKSVQRAGISLLTTYGLTEMSSQVCTGQPAFTEQGVTSGEVLPFRRVKIDRNRILVAGETLCLGYYNNGIIQPLTDNNGWYHTGDRGQWIDDQIKILGRSDNMFISGGENIYPEEIEQALLDCKDIMQAVVVAVDDKEFGQRPVAFVKVCNGLVNEAFTKWCLEGKISRFKIPDRIIPIPKELPPEFLGQKLFTGIKPNRCLLKKLVSWSLK